MTVSNKKLRILFVCHRFPWPPHEGGKIRPFHIIKHLHQSHEVTVASVVRNGSEMANIEGMSPHCGEVLVQRIKPVSARVQMVARLLSRQPSSFGYFHSSQLKRQIAKTAKQRKFDLIFVHCSSMAHYALQIPNTPKILDFGDMDSEKWLEYSRYRAFPISLGFSLEGKKLKKKELELAGVFDICTVTTAAELQTLSAYQAKSHCDWFSNGVDIDFFSPSPEEYDPNLVSFVGRMDYFPNVQAVQFFATEVLPKIQRQCPDARFVIIGAKPSRPVLQLAELPGVKVTGTVPDVRAYLASSAVNVVPLQIARGIQNKILEAMAMEIPVVASAIAAKGVDAVAGEHLLTASTPDEYCEQVVKLINNRDERYRLGRVGRQRVCSHHTWEYCLGKLDSLISNVV
jgi:sugar transferase (PEP-CTERM/EpsH1 system associated)